MKNVISRLAAAGLTLPKAPTPTWNFVPFRRCGNMVFIAWQTCIIDEIPVHTGTLGLDLTIEEGQRAAQVCALNTLAQVAIACDGDFSKVTMLKMTGFIRGTDDFAMQAKVLNGASDLFVTALGERGRHARAAIGTNSLPRHSPVEIETIFEVVLCPKSW